MSTSTIPIVSAAMTIENRKLFSQTTTFIFIRCLSE